MADKNRRTFLRDMASVGGALVLGGHPSRAQGAPPIDWSKAVGIQTTVVRDEMAKSVEATMAQLAEIGYRSVALVGFNGLDAKPYRAILDRHGLTAPQIDQGFSIGVDMERDLEACQILGIKYAEPRIGASATIRASGPAPAATRSGGAPPPSAPARGGRGVPPPQTEENAKTTAAEYNRYGQVARKYGLKVTYHNHIEHFELAPGEKTTWFDAFMRETDPNTVAMEFDVGFAAVAGQNIPEMLKQYTNRFPTWDIGDYFGIRNLDAHPNLTPNQRRLYTYAVPIGLGDVDYRTILARAQVTGMQHGFVVQGTASTWGGSMAAARTSYQNLMKLLEA